jgi:hypothetical protein
MCVHCVCAGLCCVLFCDCVGWDVAVSSDLPCDWEVLLCVVVVVLPGVNTGQCLAVLGSSWRIFVVSCVRFEFLLYSCCVMCYVVLLLGFDALRCVVRSVVHGVVCRVVLETGVLRGVVLKCRLVLETGALHET